jgi:zinc protease
VEKAADEELRRFLKEGPTEAELAMARTRILGNAARTVERIGGFGGKSDLLARSMTFTGNPDSWKDRLKWVKEATPASVRTAAAEWLSDGDYVLEVQPYPSDLAAAPAQARASEPALGTAMSLNLPAMQKATLPNGLKVVLAERHSAPVVNVSLMVDAGTSADPDGLPGVASFAQRMLEEGTASRDSMQVSEALDALGARFMTGAQLDWNLAGLNVLKATLEPSLDIFSDVVLHPAFPQKEFQRLQKERAAGIRREKAEPQSLGLRILPPLVYGAGHPYARPFTGSGTEASLARMTREDLATYHATWFKPNNATLLVVGDTTLAEVLPMIQKRFGDWKPGTVPAKAIPAVAQPEKPVVYLVDRPGSDQSIIFGAQLAPPSNDPDTVGIDLVNDVFGGIFSARINMNLREDKHWSYGVFSFLPEARGQRPYMSLSAVQTDKTKESIQELLKEYRDIAGGRPITAQELKDVQGNDTLSLPGSFETSYQLGARYGQILQFGLPEDHFNTFTGKALAFTPEKANELARRLFLPDHLVWVVVGDMAKVEAGIRSLGIGEVRKLDVDGNPVK